jgi:hypothetical protein
MANKRFFFVEPIGLTPSEVEQAFKRILQACPGAQYRAFREALDAAEAPQDGQQRTA